MHLASHLLFKVGDIVWIIRIPDRQRNATVIFADCRIIAAQFFLSRHLVIIRKIAQEQERQHVVAEIVRIHRAA